ncbi:MAG: HesA/MoeB/ThiF family protein [Burkholderiales bacterium]|nr:HesA/MoeB/ThiF family protein [Burkholderiales bacterium]
MDDTQLLRYARHLMLDEIGVEGQRALLAAHALVIGAGGLGSPAVLYLATAGVGRITVVDHDSVDLTNLQRQIAHDLSRLGQPKAESVRARVAALNPDVQLRALVQRADAASLDALVAEADVVLDCSDNFRTRHAVNAACVRHRRPLVAGAALGWEAQLTVVDPRDEASPCWACLFAPEAGHEDVACATLGVFAPLVGVVGSLQAAEALKLLAGAGRPLVGQLLLIDARTMHFEPIAVARDPGCGVCAGPRAAAAGGRLSSAP